MVEYRIRQINCGIFILWNKMKQQQNKNLADLGSVYCDNCKLYKINRRFKFSFRLGLVQI